MMGRRHVTIEIIGIIVIAIVMFVVILINSSITITFTIAIIYYFSICHFGTWTFRARTSSAAVQRRLRLSGISITQGLLCSSVLGLLGSSGKGL